MAQNTAVLFNQVPNGLPTLETFKVAEVPVPTITKDGEVLLSLKFLSVDPYMRGRMRPGLGGHFSSFKIGEPFVGGCVFEVVESRSSAYAKGDIVNGYLPWQKLVVVDASKAGLVKVPKTDGISPSTAIGVLGMPGMTSYFGLLEIGKPKKGETVVVSGAAGAVGSIVGQIAKIQGCRVVGTAGTDEKVKLLTEKYGFDAAVNYKTHDNMQKMQAALQGACPNGIDVYFDNTGGHTSDAAAFLMNERGRISVCGSISAYNAQDLFATQGPRLDFLLIYKQLKKEGFVVTQWAERFPEGIKQMTQWIQEGKIKYDETVIEGLENAGKAFIEMMTGANIGKMVVKV